MAAHTKSLSFPPKSSEQAAERLLPSYTDQDLEQSTAVHSQPGPTPQSQPRRRQLCYHYLLFLVSVLATSSLLAALFTTTGPRAGNNSTPTASHRQLLPLNASLTPEESFQPGYLTCGHSPSEARSKNCTFDLMLSTWIPTSCSDPVMMDTYLAQGNYTYFRDADRTIPMTEEEARRGEYKTLWTDGEFHLAHCVYLMDMQIRAFKTGGPVETGIFNHGHTMHCVNLTLGLEGEVHGRVTRLHAIFGGCGYPRGR